jgi:hypothetical protein
MVQYQDKVESLQLLLLLSLLLDALGWTALGATGILVSLTWQNSKGSLGMQESLNTKYQQYTTRGTITKRWFLRTERT